MSDSAITTLADEFIDAIKKGEIDAAESHLADLQVNLDESTRKEERTIARSQRIRDLHEVSIEEQRQLLKYERARMNAAFGRAGFLVIADAAVSKPSEVPIEEVEEATETFKSRESSLDESRTDIDTILAEATVPSQPVLVSVDVPRTPARNEQIVADVVVANAGDEPATDLVVSIDGNVEFDDESKRIDLEAGSTKTVKFGVTVTTTGSEEIRIQVADEDRSYSKIASLEVLGVTEGIDIAIASLQELIERIEETSLQRGRKRSLLAKLEGAKSDVERARDEIDDGKTVVGVNHVTTASNRLGAFLNDLDSEANARTPNGMLSMETRRTFETMAEEIIDQLARIRASWD